MSFPIVPFDYRRSALERQSGMSGGMPRERRGFIGVGLGIGVSIGGGGGGAVVIGPPVAVTGTILTATESQIVAGGLTIILTVTGDTWVTAGALFNAQRQAIINGLTSSSSQTNGWNAQVKANLAVTDVVRTSNTVVTITLDAEPGYAVTANETVTVTVPGSALAGAVGSIATPTFTVTSQTASAALSGTILTASAADIVAGGKTIILTLTGDIWILSGASFNAQRQAIINGLVAGTSQTNGWNNDVVPAIAVTAVVRTSASVVTITLPAVAAYSISSSETITATIPGAAVQDGAALGALPTFTITNVAAPTLDAINTTTQPSQDFSTTAGGYSITVTGTGLATAAFFVGGSGGVGGTSCTVTAQSATSLTFTAPAKAASAGYDLYATTTGGTSNILTAALRYLQAATVTKFYADGNNGSSSPFGVSGNPINIVNAPINSLGTHAFQFTTPIGVSEGCALQAPPTSVDVATYPNGIVCEFDLLFPTSTLTNMSTQIKPHLMRNAGDTLSAYQMGFGTDFGGVGNPLVVTSDFDTGTTLLYRSGAFFGDGNKHRIMVKYSGNSGELWLDGKYQSGAAITNPSFGSTSSAAALLFRCGIVFAGNGSPSAPLTGFCGMARVLDGCPPPLVNYAVVTPQTKGYVANSGTTLSLVSGTTSVTTITPAIPAGATGVIGIREAGSSLVAWTDSSGNVWLPILNTLIGSPGGNDCTFWKADNMKAASAGTLVITGTLGSGDTLRGTFAAFTGCDPISSFDVGNVSPVSPNVGTGTTADGGALTSTGANPLFVYFVMTDGDGSANGYTSPGFTIVGSDIRTALAYKIGSVQSTEHYQGSLSASVGYVCVGMCLK